MQDFRNSQNTDFTKATDYSSSGYDNTPQFPEDIAKAKEQERARQQQEASQQRQQNNRQQNNQQQNQQQNQAPTTVRRPANPLMRILGFVAWAFLLHHFFINYVTGTRLSLEDSLRQSRNIETFAQTSFGMVAIGAIVLLILMRMLAKTRGFNLLLASVATVALTMALLLFNYFPISPFILEVHQIQAEFLKTPYATEYKKYFSRRLLRLNPVLQDFLYNGTIPDTNSVSSAPTRSSDGLRTRASESNQSTQSAQSARQTAPSQTTRPAVGVIQPTVPAARSVYNFTDTRLKNELFSNTIFKQLPFKNATLENCQFINITFMQNAFENSVFVSGAIKDSKFDQAVLKNTQWNKLSVSGTQFTDTVFLNGSLSNMPFVKSAFSAVRFNSVDIRNTTFNQNTFKSSSFGDSSLIDTEFRQARFTGGHFNLATLNNVSFEQAEASDLSFEAATLTDCNFKKYTGPSTVFKKATLNSPDFSKANLPASDFSGAFVKGGKFADANLKGSSFRGAHVGGILLSSSTSLKDCDFSNATFGNIGFIHAGGITFFPANNPTAYTSKPEITRALIAVLSQAKTFKGATLPEQLQRSLAAANPSLF